MRYLEGKEIEYAKKYMEEAAKVSVYSECVKSQRGVVIVKDGKIKRNLEKKSVSLSVHGTFQ